MATQKLANEIVPGDRVKTWPEQTWYWLVEANHQKAGSTGRYDYDGFLDVRDTQTGHGDVQIYSNDTRFEVA